MPVLLEITKGGYRLSLVEKRDKRKETLKVVDVKGEAPLTHRDGFKAAMAVCLEALPQPRPRAEPAQRYTVINGEE